MDTKLDESKYNKIDKKQKRRNNKTFDVGNNDIKHNYNNMNKIFYQSHVVIFPQHVRIGCFYNGNCIMHNNTDFSIDIVYNLSPVITIGGNNVSAPNTNTKIFIQMDKMSVLFPLSRYKNPKRNGSFDEEKNKKGFYSLNFKVPLCRKDIHELLNILDQNVQKFRPMDQLQISLLNGKTLKYVSPFKHPTPEHKEDHIDYLRVKIQVNKKNGYRIDHYENNIFKKNYITREESKHVFALNSVIDIQIMPRSVWFSADIKDNSVYYYGYSMVLKSIGITKNGFLKMDNEK